LVMILVGASSAERSLSNEEKQRDSETLVFSLGLDGLSLCLECMDRIGKYNE
jgi:hypothetical protein